MFSCFHVMNENQLIGAWGEEQAVRYLLALGYDIIDRNFRTKSGEIDIIAWCQSEKRERTLSFIEVKTRPSAEVGSAERATNQKKKIGHILHVAMQYCERKKITVGTVPMQVEHVSVYQSRHGTDIVKYVIPF